MERKLYIAHWTSIFTVLFTLGADVEHLTLPTTFPASLNVSYRSMGITKQLVKS
jgi:hypothetical protein